MFTDYKFSKVNGYLIVFLNFVILVWVIPKKSTFDFLEEI